MVRDNLTREQYTGVCAEFERLLALAGISREICEKLRATDLYTAPASTRYHGTYIGGLVDHSLGVYDWLWMLNEQTGGKYPSHTIIKAALLHDLCKVNVYHKTTRNQKIDGRWQEVECWEFKEDYPLGHGEKSLDRALDLGIALSRDEKLAIRHHMGAYELTGMALKSYGQAVHDCPLVLLLHTADMMETLYGRRDKVG